MFPAKDVGNIAAISFQCIGSVCTNRVFLYPFNYRPLHLAVIHMQQPVVRAIISLAPCKECLEIYNDLRQVNAL